MDPLDGLPVPTVRDRTNSDPSTQTLNMLTPTARQAAILTAVKRNIGIGLVECAVEVARMFGSRPANSGMRALVASQAKVLADEGRLYQVDGDLGLAQLAHRPPLLATVTD